MITKVHSALKLDRVLLELESLKKSSLISVVTAKVLPYNSAATQILTFLKGTCSSQKKTFELFEFGSCLGSISTEMSIQWSGKRPAYFCSSTSIRTTLQDTSIYSLKRLHHYEDAKPADLFSSPCFFTSSPASRSTLVKLQCHKLLLSPKHLSTIGGDPHVTSLAAPGIRKASLTP